MKNNIGLFVDVGNLFFCTSKHFKGSKGLVNYAKYLAYVQETYGTTFQTFAYCTRFGNDGADGFDVVLRRMGYQTKNRMANEKGRVAWNVEIACDVAKVIDRLDAVILGSADNGLAPVAEYVKSLGLPCYAVACCVGRELKNAVTRYDEVTVDIF